MKTTSQPQITIEKVESLNLNTNGRAMRRYWRVMSGHTLLAIVDTKKEAEAIRRERLLRREDPVRRVLLPSAEDEARFQRDNEAQW